MTVTGGTVKVVQIRNATGGTFTLSFNGTPTAPLAFGASAADVQAALNGLATVALCKATVTKTGNTYTVAFFLSTSTNASRQAGDQSETTIAVNPANPLNIVIGVNDDDPIDGIFGSGTSSDHVYVSMNGGTSFTRIAIPTPAGTFGSHGDPTLVFSRDGSRLVYSHLVDKTAGQHGR